MQVDGAFLNALQSNDASVVDNEGDSLHLLGLWKENLWLWLTS